MIASLCQVNLTELKVHDIVKMELMCNLMIASLCQVNLTELKVHDIVKMELLCNLMIVSLCQVNLNRSFIFTMSCTFSSVRLT
jgi:hypothetical protein